MSVTEVVPEAHPLSLYVEVAVPAALVTGLVIVALPLHAEEVNVTAIGTVAGEPFTSIGTLKLLVP